MNYSKLNRLILPLLFSALLTLLSLLRFGPSINQIFHTLLFPIHTPISLFHHIYEQESQKLIALPKSYQENQSLKKEIANLIYENQTLNQIIKENNITAKITAFKSIIPVRSVGGEGSFTYTTNQTTDSIEVGMPLVSDKTLIGLVSSVKGQLIQITPLNSDKLLPISIRTASNQKGIFRYENNTPLIFDISNLTPLVSSDYVVTDGSEYIPPNLLLGKVNKIISVPQDPLQKAQIELNKPQIENDTLFIITQY